MSAGLACVDNSTLRRSRLNFRQAGFLSSGFLQTGSCQSRFHRTEIASSGETIEPRIIRNRAPLNQLRPKQIPLQQAHPEPGRPKA
jgi:hypothetical protein